MIRDLRYALRQLRKRPAFALVVVLMLALGIGANTAVFSVMNAALMQLLPVGRPQGLFYVHEAHDGNQPPGATSTGDSRTSFSLAAFEALRQRKDVFEELIAYAPLSISSIVGVRHGGLPEQAEGEAVSGNFFSGLGVRMALGRGFSQNDETNHSSTVVLNYDYWTRSFARDPSILGQTIYIKGVAMTVVGVTARGFKGIEPASVTDFWVPLQNRHDLNIWGADWYYLYDAPTQWWSLRLMARLRPGITPMQAQQALMGTFGEVARQAVGTIDPQQWQPLLEFAPARGIDGYNQELREPVQILMGLVALVLLIACTNVAMMIQARNSDRQREFSLRLAIGAGRASIFRQLLCESLLLVAAGAALGWIFALGATEMLARWSEIETGLAPDRNVLLFTLTVSAVAALGFGLVPLWNATHAPVAGVLRATALNLTTSKSRILGGRAVLASQIAVCLVLLMVAMLLLRTLSNYMAVNLGMETQGLLVFGITPQGQGDSHIFYRTLLERLRQAPGVVSVSMSENRLGSGWSDNNTLVLDGVEQHGGLLRTNSVGPGFFHTIGVPVLAGRDVLDSDTPQTESIVLVNETFVNKYLPHTQPLGHMLGNIKHPAKIAGVVRDSKYCGVDEKSMPMAYYAQMQASSLGTMHIEVRVRGDALAALPVMRKVVAEVDPNVPIERPMTQQQQFEESYTQQRMFAALGGFFGALAALLVATGLYGSHSFRVSRRTTEIGVRMALGASRGQVLSLMMRESLWVLAGGLGAGIPLTLLAIRPLKSMLYQMQPFDAASLTLAIAAITFVSIGAALIPARRAASIEPMRALRNE
jgi:predicted permease